MTASPENRRLLLVDGPGIEGMTDSLNRLGYPATLAAGIEDARHLLHRDQPDALMIGVDALRAPMAVASLREASPGTALLILTAPAQVTEASRLLREGADDYLLLPPDDHELRVRLGRILDRLDLDDRIAFFRDQLTKGDSRTLEARSPAMQRVTAQIGRVAPMRSTVLISGESGVGKELVARLIHLNSPRRDQAFIALNCAAMPGNLIESELFGHEKGAFTGAHARNKGKFEIAHRGTLFLDEIGDMDITTQAKLLRVLEQREFMRVGGDRSVRVDVRLIAATNAVLERLVAQNAFRRDLYYRLKVVTIQVPPLRERADDVPTLVHTFLEELARTNGVPRKEISEEALQQLTRYHWPGNVRELKNLIESALVSVPGTTIGLDDLPAQVTRAESGETPRTGRPVAGTSLAEMERALIEATLEHTGGNRTHSAMLLGIGVRTLQRKIQSYGIEIASTRRRPRKPRSTD